MKKKMFSFFTMFVLMSALSIECALKITIKRDKEDKCSSNPCVIASFEYGKSDEYNSKFSNYKVDLEQFSRICNMASYAFTYASKKHSSWLNPSLDKCATAANALGGVAKAGVIYSHYHAFDGESGLWLIRSVTMSISKYWISCCLCDSPGKEGIVSNELLNGGLEALEYMAHSIGKCNK